jgi:serine phosphatase RsbU (regulator of sigma subunit)
LKEQFDSQKRELAESLRYAGYIQKALLPSDVMVKQLLNDYFIYFRPRDIVSGDFYWITRKGDLIYIAIGDCTGHGIPGAFLSLLGISFLNQIVDNQKYILASSILNVLREYIMKALNQTGAINERKDGIDLSICIYNDKKGELNYAGAFHSLYIVRQENKILEIAGDKMQIGVAADEEQPFTNHVINIEKGDMIYMFTDGYVDQFGGPHGKKFKYSNFRNLLLDIFKLPCQNQTEKLEQTINDWKGNQPQLDDILIFGIRIN